MARLAPQDWRPAGIDDLEPDAWYALKQAGCVCVIAGPGAGKTEFLAQRAVYLLQTGICSPPHRILAISFKSDAAENLTARVRRRCPPELSGRFVSLTFDAFTKGLVDRFLSAIPSDWRPTRPYDIAFPTRRQVEDFLTLTRISAPAAWQAEIGGLGIGNFEARYVGGSRMPLARAEPRSGIEYAVDRWWAGQLREGGVASLTFVALNRLAELLLRANPQILRALRATYPFVFVDEFQDTTYAQYDFLLSAFADGHTAVTAVGDDKQRIMAWAGARTDAFQRFQKDFAGTRISLRFNFRSSPDLVRIQQVVARALDANTVATVSQTAGQVNDGVAQVWNSQTRTAEADHLAHWLAQDISQRRRSPRDYALLVRQKADEYEEGLAPALAGAGLFIRNESHTLGHTTLQDLLSDELCGIAVALLRLGATSRAPDAWCIASSSIQALRAADSADQIACQSADAELTSFLTDLRATMAAGLPTREAAVAVAELVFAFLAGC